MQNYSLLLTGVGGQGNILASDIIGDVALTAGYDVKKTDTLGMAQRGGSVISHLRLAKEVQSPLIKEGETDILLGFEKLETVRWAHYLKPGGIAIINDNAIPPLSVNQGLDHYPTDTEIRQIMQQRTDKLHLVDGTGKAMELGNARALNIFMLGCLSQFLHFPVKAWQDAIALHLPERLLQLNLAAFDMGRKEVV